MSNFWCGLLCRGAVPRRRHGDHAVGDRPAVQALAQRRAHALLGGGDEGRRQPPALDARARTRRRARPARPRRAARCRPGRGCRARPIRSTAAPVPTTRSMQTTEVSEKRARTPYRSSSSAAITSFCTSPCRLTAASPSVSSRRRSISGSSSASSVRPANSAVRWVGSSGSTSACSVAGAKRWVRRRGGRPNGVADPGGRPAHDRDLAGAARRARPSTPPGPLTADLGHPLRPGPAERRPGRAPGPRPTTAAPTRAGRARRGRRRRPCRPAARRRRPPAAAGPR